jgi:hypothetical protein
MGRYRKSRGASRILLPAKRIGQAVMFSLLVSSGIRPRERPAHLPMKGCVAYSALLDLFEAAVSVTSFKAVDIV